MRNQFVSIDDYNASFPLDVQQKLQGIRAVIRRTAPDAEEAIRYGIPTFRLNNTNLVHFAAFSHHVSFFLLHPVSGSSGRNCLPITQAKVPYISLWTKRSLPTS